MRPTHARLPGEVGQGRGAWRLPHGGRWGSAGPSPDSQGPRSTPASAADRGYAQGQWTGGGGGDLL